MGKLGEWIDRLQHRVYFRPCKDVQCWISQGYHSHHFTAWGYYHYVSRHL